MAYELSNGHVTDDRTASQHPKVLWGSAVDYPSDGLSHKCRQNSTGCSRKNCTKFKAPQFRNHTPQSYAVFSKMFRKNMFTRQRPVS